MTDIHYMFDLFFQHQIKSSMYSGIEVTMKASQTLHLCALALSTYTEVLGGLVTGKLKIKREERNNYEAFLPYLGSGYDDLNRELKLRIYQDQDGKLRHLNLYSLVRSKLVHEFAPRLSYQIIVNNPITDRRGLEYSFGDSLPIDFKYKNENAEHHPAPDRLTINVAEYYRDFKGGVERYYSELKEEMKKDAFHRPLFNNFYEATIERVGTGAPES